MTIKHALIAQIIYPDNYKIMKSIAYNIYDKTSSWSVKIVAK